MKDSKHIRRDFHSVAWVTPQGWDFGAQGVPRGSNFFFQTWSCGISNSQGWQAEQNASNIFFLGSNWWPWGEVKGQISLNFGYHVNFKDFYTKLCVRSHKWKIQNILNRIFILLPGSCPWWDSEVLGGVKNFSVGICDGAPSTAWSICFYVRGTPRLNRLSSCLKRPRDWATA